MTTVSVLLYTVYGLISLRNLNRFKIGDISVLIIYFNFLKDLIVFKFEKVDTIILKLIYNEAFSFEKEFISCPAE